MGYRHLNYYLISDTPRKYITTTLAHASTNSSKRIHFYLKTNISLDFKKIYISSIQSVFKTVSSVQAYPFVSENEHVLMRLALNRSKFSLHY